LLQTKKNSFASCWFHLSKMCGAADWSLRVSHLITLDNPETKSLNYWPQQFVEVHFMIMLGRDQDLISPNFEFSSNFAAC
jgi:hypothetical protein